MAISGYPITYPSPRARITGVIRRLRSSFYFTKRFLGVWVLFAMFFLTMFYSIGWVPANVQEFADSLTSLVVSTGERIEAGSALLPAPDYNGAKIIIPAIGVNAPMVLPNNDDLDVLNSALTRGVVHYPGSALPSESGNVFLFGHSTGLAVVHNKAYEVFNHIHKLQSGDVIRLRYGGREYWYQVSSVRIAKASEALVDLNSKKRMLTISTCRIFGAKDERFVVEAAFMRSYPLGNPAPGIAIK